MTEPLRDDLGVDAGAQELGRMSVAQIMKADVDPGPLLRPAKCPIEA